jgi:hypothetical protein
VLLEWTTEAHQDYSTYFNEETPWKGTEAFVSASAAKAALAAFIRTSKLPSRPLKAPAPPRVALLKSKVLPSFNNGRKLRDYQETSLHWMINNYRGDCAKGVWEPRNCILGDEVRSKGQFCPYIKGCGFCESAVDTVILQKTTVNSECITLAMG